MIKTNHVRSCPIILVSESSPKICSDNTRTFSDRFRHHLLHVVGSPEAYSTRLFHYTIWSWHKRLEYWHSMGDGGRQCIVSWLADGLTLETDEPKDTRMEVSMGRSILQKKFHAQARTYHLRCKAQSTPA